MNVSVDSTPATSRMPAHRVQQPVVVLADDLDQDVERAGGDHDVVDLVERGERVGDLAGVAAGADADHRLAGEADLHRVGDADDLQDAGVEQPLHPLADGGLGQPDGGRRSGRRDAGRPPATAR